MTRSPDTLSRSSVHWDWVCGGTHGISKISVLNKDWDVYFQIPLNTSFTLLDILLLLYTVNYLDG